MKTIIKFFSSIWLGVLLSILICLTAAYGSIVVVKNPEFYSSIDGTVLFPFLFSAGLKNPELLAWIYVLMLLVALFAVNTVVCTINSIALILRVKKPLMSLFPHIIHVGFAVALTGHLVGSSFGFKTTGTIAYKGIAVPVPNAKGLFVRLDEINIKTSLTGNIESLGTHVTLLRDGAEILSQEIRLNSPLIYKGIAFYHADQGAMPTGLVLQVNDEEIKTGFSGKFSTNRGDVFTIGPVYPDFEFDSVMGAYSRSSEFRNPHVEITSSDGRKAYLNISETGRDTVLSGAGIRLKDYIRTEYAVLTINRDPGIALIVLGSAILTIGMLLLIFFQRERMELVRKKSPSRTGNGQEA